MNDLISIIVPLHNVEQYLERCINSILQQTYQNLEIILIDDGSTDGSAKICDDYASKDSRIKVIHKQKAGVSAARNSGFAIATGTYIGCVDSDDWIEPDMYETMYRATQSYQVPIAFCRYASVFEHETYARGTGKEFLFSREELLRNYINGSEDYVINNSVWSKLFHRDLAKDILFAEGRVSEDIMYTTRLLCKLEQGVYIDRCLYNYKQDRPGSIMNSNRVQRVIQDEIPFWKEHISYVREHVSDEMGDYAAYYFYRRMMLYYTDLKGNKENKLLVQKIAELMKREKKDIISIYSGKTGTAGDKVRMRLFLFSPKLYYWMNETYGTVVVPLKQR